MYVCMYVNICVYIYIYAYLNTQTRIHTHTGSKMFIHMHKNRLPKAVLQNSSYKFTILMDTCCQWIHPPKSNISLQTEKLPGLLANILL